MGLNVSVVVPCLTEQEWQVELTKAVISIARLTTEVPFELIVAEAAGFPSAGGYFSSHGPTDVPCKHFYNSQKGSANADMNKGMDLASGDVVVLLTNDVFVKPGWLEALLECFERVPDCGMASLGTSDHREQSVNVITEGLWCPLMALRNRPDFRFDAETFPSYWGDSDLVMRVYNAGFRAYRNRRVVCDHLGRATNTPSHPQGGSGEIEAARQRFVARHGPSHQLIFRVLMDGLIV